MKVVKKIGKAVKSAFKGVKKVFKEITSSKIGKTLLVAGAVFLGGAALGFWNVPGWVPFSGKVNGAFVKGASSNATAAATGADVAGSTVTAAEAGASTASQKLGSMVGKEAATFGGGSATGTATVPASALPQSGLPNLGTNAATTTSQNASSGAKWNSLVEKAGKPAMDTTTVAGGGTAAAKPGLIGKAVQGAKNVGTFVNENPVPSMMMMNAAASMAAPDEYDILEKQRQLEAQDRERREKNYDVAGIDLGVAPTPRKFTWSNGTPVFENGLIGGS